MSEYASVTVVCILPYISKARALLTDKLADNNGKKAHNTNEWNAHIRARARLEKKD